MKLVWPISLVTAVVMQLILFAQTRPQPFNEPMKVKILKVERAQEERDGNAWFRIKIIFRDEHSRLYDVRADCISSFDSPKSCANYLVPRVGVMCDVLNYGDMSAQFADQKTFYEIVSIELVDCQLAGGIRTK